MRLSDEQIDGVLASWGERPPVSRLGAAERIRWLVMEHGHPWDDSVRGQRFLVPVKKDLTFHVEVLSF